MDKKIVNELILQIYDTNIGDTTTLSELLSKTHYKVLVKDMPKIFTMFLDKCNNKGIKIDSYDSKESKLNYASPFKRI